VKISENFKEKFEKISNFSENKRKPVKSKQVAELSELQKVNYFGPRVPKLPYTYGKVGLGQFCKQLGKIGIYLK